MKFTDFLKESGVKKTPGSVTDTITDRKGGEWQMYPIEVETTWNNK